MFISMDRILLDINSIAFYRKHCNFVACQNISDLILLELGAHQNWRGEVSQKVKLKGGGDGV